MQTTWYRDESKGEPHPSYHQPAMKKKRKKGARKGDGIKTTTVVFIPSTRGGLLIKKMRENEEKLSQLTGFRVKYQEAGGTKLCNIFSTDTGKGFHCGREPCPPCDIAKEDKERVNCKARKSD